MRLGRIAAGFLILWIGFLALSTALRLARGIEYSPKADQVTIELDAEPEWATSDKVILAYNEYGNSHEGTPVLLLHGNPMAGRALRELGVELGEERHVLAPDLPGLGFSSRNLKEFSAVNQASVLFEWLDQRDVNAVDLIAYSQGGAVALEMAARLPGRIRSLTLISSVGLQEYELLGNYTLNQPIYTIYAASLWSLRWLTPHFGLLDDPVFSVSGAKNFADTDLRRNRALLEQIDQPVLILHSSKDRLVPYLAAKAHATILAQSYFIPLPGGHMGLFSHHDLYAEAVIDFLARVDGGEARTTNASVSNKEEPGFSVEADRSVQLLQIVLIGLLLFLMVFVSEDLACIGGGILAAGGVIPLGGAVLACFLGIWVSDIGLYFLGRIFGQGVLRMPFLRGSHPASQIDYFRRTYRDNGLKVVFTTRFLPGSRVIAYTTAGFLHLGWLRFSVWLFLAAAIWTPILVSVAFFVGQPLIHWWEIHGLILLPLLLIVVLGLYFSVGLLTDTFTYRGRAKLRGRWRRLTHWEYWPTFPIYLPVFIYGIGLSIRYRSLTLWALCNPGMTPLSGLAMESKSSILKCLSEEDGRLPHWCLLSSEQVPGDRFNELERFMQSKELDWPIVLKPDVGQRGEGVAIIHDKDEASRYLASNSEPLIAQEYAGGQEYGVFYYRFPKEQKGHIFSITKKVLPEVVGDGQRTLEQLILDHPRFVAQAQHYLKMNAGSLDTIPASGETHRLVDLGTHCRGAIFLDGGEVADESLVEALDDILANYKGFHFGRFDLKLSEGKSLESASAFKIIELNGVSSESTDVYDPKNSIVHAWRKLCRQWQLAFLIGDANRKLGHQPPVLMEVFRVLRQHNRRMRNRNQES